MEVRILSVDRRDRSVPDTVLKHQGIEVVGRQVIIAKRADFEHE